MSGGKRLVCDVQGTWNPDDGFLLTDPVVHYISSRDPDRKHKNGATDEGRAGARRFFETHKCNGLCERLRLQRPSDDLMCAPVHREAAQKAAPSSKRQAEKHVRERRAPASKVVVSEDDVRLVMRSTGASRAEAAGELRHFNGDIVNAIMQLSRRG